MFAISFLSRSRFLFKPLAIGASIFLLGFASWATTNWLALPIGPQPIGWCADYRGRRYRREPLDGSVLKGCTPCSTLSGLVGSKKDLLKG